MKRTALLLTLTLTLTVRPARAVFGEENAPLYQLVWESIKQSLQLTEIITLAKETSDFARETAGFARAAVQVTRNVQAVINDPERYFHYAINTWYDQFPELHATLANAYTARDLFDDAIHPSRLPEYDAYAYNRALDALEMMNRSGFEVLAHAVDTYGVNDPHDKAIEGLRVQYEMAHGNLEKLAHALNTTGISPVEADVYTAQATAITATAAVEATATLQRMARTMELQFAGEQDEKMRAKVVGVEQDAATMRLLLKNWQLDPTRSRLREGAR